MLLPPLDPQKLAAFSLTSIEREMKRDMLFPPGLGIPLNALTIEQYSVPQGAQQMPHPADIALLKDNGNGAAEGVGRVPGVRTGRRRDGIGGVTWLMRTKYITNDAGEEVLRRVGRSANAEVPEGEQKTEEEVRAEQIKAIEASFEAAKSVPKHPRNPDAVPLEVLPVLPDEVLAEWAFVATNFDGDPTSDVSGVAKLSPAERQAAERMLHIKTFKLNRPGGKAQSVAAMLLPRRMPSTAAATAPEEGAPFITPADRLYGDYDWVREYDTSVTMEREDQSKTFLLRLAKDHVGYSELHTRLGLKKRKRGDFDQQSEDELGAFAQPEKLIITPPGVEVQEDAEQQGGEAAAEEQQQVEDIAPTGGPDEGLLRDLFGSDDEDGGDAT